MFSHRQRGEMSVRLFDIIYYYWNVSGIYSCKRFSSERALVAPEHSEPKCVRGMSLKQISILVLL